MKTRTGKIARLPYDIRNQLNRRLNDGEFGNDLVAWLNDLPEVQQTLAEHFDSQPVSAQNLSEWKAGGYRDWLLQQEALDLAGAVVDDADELTETTGGTLTDKMSVWLAARRLEDAGDGEAGDDERNWKRLRELGKDIVALRRGDHQAARLRLERERFEHSKKEDFDLALGIFKDAARDHREVWEQLMATWALLKRRMKGDYSDYNKGHPTQSNQAPGICPSIIPPKGHISPISPITPMEDPAAKPTPSEHRAPGPDPEKEAYNRWFRMNCGAEPFDPQELERLYAAIPRKE